MRIPATIGAVEISTDAVRLAVVRTRGGAPGVVDLTQSAVRTDSDEARVAALRDAYGRLKTSPPIWVLVAPASWSIVRLLTVPFRSPRKVAAAVPFELEPNLAVPIDDLVIKHVRARSEGGATTVLAIGVRRAAIAKQVLLAEQAGLAIEGAYLDAIALTSLWFERQNKFDGARAVLHFRPGEAQLAVVEAGRLVYLRRLDSDPGEFRAAPSAVAREVGNLLRAYAADRGVHPPVDSLSITGAQLNEAARTVFEGEVDVPVHYEEMVTELPGFARHVTAAEAVSDEFNRWSAPIAAAACAAGGAFHVQLLASDMVSCGTSRNIVRPALAACVAGALTLASYLALVYLDNRRTERALERYGEAIWQEFRETFPDMIFDRPDNDTGGVESFRLFQQAAEAETATSLGVSLDTFSAPTLLDILMEVTAAIQPSVVEIEEINIRPLRGYRELMLRGRVVDSAKYNEALERLDQSELLEVSRDQSTRITEGGRETFTIRARM